MILCAHADAGFLNETNFRSRAGAHISLSEDDPFPLFNGAILSIAQIIMFVMSSAAESELAALLVTAREMIPHRQTLIDMGWPQSKSPIQTDNSTAAGVTSNTIVPRRSKMMDMQFWWLRCRTSQDQFRYYWDAGKKNWADYNTKHHPDTYHEAHRSTHAGSWDWVDTCTTTRPTLIGPPGFPFTGVPFFFFFFFFANFIYLSCYIFSPHRSVAAKVCRSPDSHPRTDR